MSAAALATDREGVRWTWALIAVTLLAGTLRAGPALHPNPYLSADERGYTNVATRLAETGRYGRESLHWPPGAPGAFAAAHAGRRQPVLGAVAGRHAADPARLPARRRRACAA